MMTHPPLLGQWCVWGSVGQWAGGGTLLPTVATVPTQLTSSCPCPGSTRQHTPAKLGTEVVIHNLHPTHLTLHSLDPPDTEGGIFHYPWLEENVEVDNVETLTMVISFTIDNFSGEAFIRNEGKP